MKYWCYYTDVVRYLERIEAGQSQKTEAPAYLVWQDDDGPSMIAGPGIEWYRGDGPPPDIDAINLRAGRPPAPAPPNRNKRRRPTIGSGTGDCAPAPSHTTGRTVFRIRRLDPAAYLLAARSDGITNP